MPISFDRNDYSAEIGLPGPIIYEIIEYNGKLTASGSGGGRVLQ